MRAMVSSPGGRHSGVETVHHAVSGVGHQGDLALLARLEAHGGAGGDVQAQAAGRIAVELRASLVSWKW